MGIKISENIEDQKQMFLGNIWGIYPSGRISGVIAQNIKIWNF
jgi:hypothetical protein